jgi:hypothetical protein
MSLAAAETVISKALQRGAKAANAREHRGVRNKLKTVAGMKNPSRKKPAQGSKTQQKRTKKAAGGAGRLQVTRFQAPAARGFNVGGRSSRRSVADTGVCETVFSVSSPVTAGIWTMLRTDLINPANTELFPRASQMAGTFEKWRLLAFSVEYIPLAPSTDTGLVGMYIDMDPTDPATTNLTSTMENRYKDAGNVWLPRKLSLSRNDIRRWYYTDPAQEPTVPAAALDRQNSPGVLRVFCDKCAANRALGMIKISSHFQFTDAKPPAALLLYSAVAQQTLTVQYDPATSPTAYVTYPIDIKHAHGFSVIGARAAYASGGAVNNDQTDDIQSGGVAANNAASTDYSFVLTATTSAKAGTANFGADGKVQHALFYVKPDMTIGDLWLGNQSAAGVTTVPASSPADSAVVNIPATATRLFFGVKIIGSGVGLAAGTALYSNAGPDTMAIARRAALPGYGLARSSAATPLNPPESRSGQLPDAELDSWLSAHAGDSYSLTVYPPPPVSQQQLDEEFLRRLRAVGPLLNEDWQDLSRRVCAEPPSPTPSVSRPRAPVTRK